MSDQTGDVQLKVTSDSSQAQADLKKLSASVGQIEKTTSDASKNLISLARGVTAAFAAFGAINALNKASDAMLNIENQLALVTGRTNDLIYAQDQLVRISMRTRSTMAGSASVYTTFAKSLDKTTASMDDLLEVTETLQKAIAISGSSAESAQAALIQLGQGLQSGTLRGEELNSVLEQTPRVAKAIAEGLGLTVGQMRNLAVEGGLTADRVFTALRSQTGKLNKEFATLAPTFQQGSKALTDASQRFLSELSTGLGISSSIGSILFKSANFVNEKSKTIASDSFLFASKIRESLNDALRIGRAFGEVFEAIGVQASRAMPYIQGFGLGVIRSLLNMTEAFDAKYNIGIYNAIKSTKLFFRELEAHGGFDKYLGINRIGTGVAAAFRAKDVNEFVLRMHDLSDIIKDKAFLELINPTTRRTFFTKLLDETPMIRSWGVQIKQWAINLGVMEGHLFTIGNIRMDKFKGALDAVTSSMGALFSYSIMPRLQPFLVKARYALFTIGQLFAEGGENMGGVRGNMIRAFGQMMERTFAFAPDVVVKAAQAWDNGVNWFFTLVFGNLKKAIVGIGPAIATAFMAGLGALKGSAVLFKPLEDMLNVWRNMVDGVVVYTKKLQPVIDWILDFCRKVARAFYDVWDKVVGHSYWPDLVEGVISWANKMVNVTGSIIGKFVAMVKNAFKNLMSSLRSLDVGNMNFVELFLGWAAALMAVTGVVQVVNNLMRALAGNAKTAGAAFGVIGTILFPLYERFMAFGLVAAGIVSLAGTIVLVFKAVEKVFPNLAASVEKTFDRMTNSFRKFTQFVLNGFQKSTWDKVSDTLFSIDGTNIKQLITTITTAQSKMRAEFMKNVGATSEWSDALGLLYVKLGLALSSKLGYSNPISKMFADTVDMSHLAIGAILSWSDVFNIILGKVKAFGSSVTRVFYDMWDKIVGHSYWPDMIIGVAQWTEKLQPVADKIVKFGAFVTKAFKAAWADITNSNLWKSLEDIADNIGLDKAADKFKKFGEHVKSAMQTAAKYIKDQNLTSFQMKDVKAKVNPVKDMIANISTEEVARLARILALGIAGAIYFSFASLPVQLAMLNYLARGVGEAVIGGINALTGGKVGATLGREIGAALGDAAGMFFRTFAAGIPGMINSLFVTAESFGKAFLNQFGLLGKAIRSLANIATGGMGDGLLGAILFGASSKALLGKDNGVNKMIDGFMKGIDTIQKGAINAASHIGKKTGGGTDKDGKTTPGTTMLERVMTGDRGKIALAGVAAILSAFTDEVNIVQGTLLGAPLIVTALLGTDVTGKIVLDVVKKVALSALTWLKNYFDKVSAGESVLSKMLGAQRGADAATALGGMTDRIKSFVGKSFDIFNRVSEDERKKAFMGGKMTLKEYFMGTAIQTGDFSKLGKKGVIGEDGQMDMFGESFTEKMKTVRMRPQVQSELDFGSDQAKATATRVSTIGASVRSFFKNLFWGKQSQAEVVADAAATAGAAAAAAEGVTNAAAAGGGFFKKFFSENAMGVKIAAMGSSINGFFTGMSTKAENLGGPMGAIGKFAFGKAGFITILLAGLALFAGAANAAETGVNKASDSMIDKFAGVATAALAVAASIASIGITIASFIGIDALMAGISAIGTAIVGFFTGSILGPIIAIGGAFGLLYTLFFGEGDSFTAKLDSVFEGMKKKLAGLSDAKIFRSAGAKELAGILPNQIAGHTQIDFEDKFNKIDFSKMTEDQKASIKRMTERVADLSKKAREQEHDTGSIDSGTMMELNKSIEMLTRSIDRNTAARPRDLKGLKNGLDDAIGLDGHVQLPTPRDPNKGIKAQAAEQGKPIAFVDDVLSLRGLITGVNYLVKKFTKDPTSYQTDMIGYVNGQKTDVGQLYQNTDFTKYGYKSNPMYSGGSRSDEFAKLGRDSQFNDLKSIYGDLTPQQQQEASEAIVKLTNATAEFKKVSAGNWFGIWGDEFKKAETNLEKVSDEYTQVIEKIIQAGDLQKRIRLYQDEIGKTAESLKKYGINSDKPVIRLMDSSELRDLNMNLKELDSLQLQLDKSADSGEASMPLQKKFNDLLATVKNQVESAAAKQSLAESLQKLIKDAGMQIDMKDLVNLDSTSYQRAHDQLQQLGIATQELAKIKPEDGVEAMAKAYQKVTKLSREVEETMRSTRSNMMNLVNDVNKAGSSTNEFDLAGLSAKDQDRLDRLAAAKNRKSDLLKGIGTDGKVVELPTAEKQRLQAEIADLDRQREELVNKGKYKTALGGIADLSARSGIGMSPEDMFGQFGGDPREYNTLITAMQEVAKIRKSLETADRAVTPLGDVMFGDPKKVAGQIAELKSWQELVENIKMTLSQRSGDAASKAGIAFDMENIRDIAPDAVKAIDDATADLIHWRRERDKLSSRKGSLLPDDMKEFERLSAQIRKTTHDLNEMLSTNITARLSKLNSMSGSNMSVSRLLNISDDDREELNSLYKQLDLLNEQRRGLEKTKPGTFELINPEGLRRNVKQTEDAQKQIADITDGRMNSLIKRSGIDVSMRSIGFMDESTRETVKGNMLEMTRLSDDLKKATDQVQFEGFTPAVAERIRGITDRMDQLKSSTEALSLAFGNALSDVSNALSKAGYSMDNAVLGKMGPERLTMLQNASAKLVELNAELAASSKDDIKNRQRILALRDAEIYKIDRINKAEARKNQLNQDFQDATKTFFRDAMTGKLSDAFHGFMDKITNSILDNFADQLSQYVVKGFGVDLGKAFGDLFGTDMFGTDTLGTASNPMWVKGISDYANGVSKPKNVSDNLSKMWGDFKKKANSVWESVKSGFSEAVDTVKSGFSETWDSVKSSFDETIGSLGTWWETFSTSLSDTWDSVQSGFESIFGSLGGSLSEMLGGLGDGMSSILSTLSDSLSSVIEGLSSMFSGGGGGLGSMFSGGGEGGGFAGMAGSLASWWGGLSFDTGGVVPGSLGQPHLAMVHAGETILPTHKKDLSEFGSSSQQFSINVTGDVSQQTRKEIMNMIPHIAAGVNKHNYENGMRK
jgi:tape measure domain-containing protein